MRFNENRYHGQRFGRLTASVSRRVNGTTMVDCICDRGKSLAVRSHNLLSGGSQSCGCLRMEALVGSTRNRKHPTHGYMLSYYKSNAKKAGVPWDLTNESFTQLTSSDCYYCGSLPQERTADARKNSDLHVLANGIDRKDSKLGYTSENVVTCCTTCNRAKLSMSVEEFISWVERVYQHTRTNGNIYL